MSRPRLQAFLSRWCGNSILLVGYRGSPIARGYHTNAVFKPALPDDKSPLSKIPIPTTKEWKTRKRRGGRESKFIGHRHLKDYSIAKACVAHFDPAFYKDTNVIEVNPGPGIFTRALFNQINPNTYVLFDRGFQFEPSLRPLLDPSNGRIKHLDLNGWDFQTYAEVIKRKIIVPQVQPPSKPNSSLIFVLNLTDGTASETQGLVSQFISFMYDNIFLYHFGRVRTYVWMADEDWSHLLAPVGHADRKKMTIMRELTCDARVVAKTSGPDVPQGRSGRRRKVGRIPIDLPLDESIVNLKPSEFDPQLNGALIELTPFEKRKSVATLQELEYLLLKLFILDQRPLQDALRIVAPGAEVLVDAIQSYDPSQPLPPLVMSTEQWVQLADAFHNWPFKPDVCEDDTYIGGDSDIYAAFSATLSSKAVALLDAETVDDGEDHELPFEGQNFEEATVKGVH